MDTPRFGLYLLAAAILAFVLQSELVQLVQSNFYKPFLVLFVEHSMFSALLPMIYLYRRWILKCKPEAAFDREIHLVNELPRLFYVDPFNDFVLKVFLLTVAFTVGTLTWYMSVSIIKLGELTAIYNTSCFFTYVLSVIVKKEAYSQITLLGVILSLVGIGVIALTDESLEIELSLGYIYAIISSVGTAVYEVLYAETVVPLEPSVSFSLFVLGLVGVVSFVGGLFLLPICHFLQWETFDLPLWQDILYLFVNGLLGMVFNALFFMVIAFTTPVIAAVGILMTIPLTALVDTFFWGTGFGLNLLLGIAFIVVGFGLLQIPNTAYRPLEHHD